MTVNLRIATLALVLVASVQADAHGIIRRAGSGLAIASSVTIPAGAELLYVGGTLPDLNVDGPGGKLPPGSSAMAAQARSVLGKIEAELQAAGYLMSDIVKMDVFLVGESDRGGAVDVAGLASAYLAYFGEDRGGVPTRTTVQVGGLPVPGALVQIAVTAARTPHPAGE